MDWVWSALHLDDGTHLHGVDIRIPGAPPIGIGYMQQPGVPLVELQAVTARETFGDNGLPQTTCSIIGDLTATIDVRGHAPVLLTSPDGRVSHFPRAWASGRHRRRPHRYRLGGVEPQPALRPVQALSLGQADRHDRAEIHAGALVSLIGVGLIMYAPR